MRRRRAGRSHGIEVSRRVADNSWDPMSGEMLIRRICVGYEDGRKTCFIPEGGGGVFSQDEAHRVVGMLHSGSEALEWGLTSSEGRVPGMGPYDTGAV